MLPTFDLHVLYIIAVLDPLMDLCMVCLLHLVDFYGTSIGKHTSPMESVIATGLATFLLAWLATGYRASFHASGLPDTLRLVSYRVYPSLPKSSKYLVRRCMEPLKAFPGRI